MLTTSSGRRQQISRKSLGRGAEHFHAASACDGFGKTSSENASYKKSLDNLTIVTRPSSRILFAVASPRARASLLGKVSPRQNQRFPPGGARIDACGGNSSPRLFPQILDKIFFPPNTVITPKNPQQASQAADSVRMPITYQPSTTGGTRSASSCPAPLPAPWQPRARASPPRGASGRRRFLRGVPS